MRQKKDSDEVAVQESVPQIAILPCWDFCMLAMQAGCKASIVTRLLEPQVCSIA